MSIFSSISNLLSKKGWIRVGIGAAVVIALLGIVKILPFWTTLLVLGLCVVGGISYLLTKKSNTSQVEEEEEKEEEGSSTT